MKRKPRSLTECNCSICRRYGALWAYYTSRQVIIIAAPDAMSAYVWGDRTIEFYHCRQCGCLTHYESIEKQPDSRVGVNARMLPVDIVSAIPIKRFDGANTWKYLND